MMSWNGAGWMVGLCLMVVGVLLVAAVCMTIAAARSVGGRPHRPARVAGPHADAEKLLDIRFARGEIGAEELARARDALRLDRWDG